MTTSALVRCVDLDAVPRLDVSAWRDDVLRRHTSGARLVTLFGRRADDAVTLTAVFREAAGELAVTRTVAAREVGVHALTEALPALHCFEREVHEQTALRIAGHPWLKPIRYEGGVQHDMDAYPFYRVEGKEVHEVAVGPIHAGVIEPGSFRFMCHGERVHHLEIHLGYQHRGVEAELLRRDPLRLTPLVETVAGDTSVAHAWASCAAIEALSGTALGLEVDLSRAFALELERVAMHLAGLSGLAADVGFLQGATTYGRLRTTAINTTLRLCGSRFGRGAVRLGGSGMHPVDDGLGADLRANLDLLQRDLLLIHDLFFSARTVRHRLRGVGVLSAAQARDLGVVGMAARASGVALDLRDGAPGGAYHTLPIAPCVFEGGDCWDRAQLRRAEIDASLVWLQAALRLPTLWARGWAPLAPIAPRRLAVSLVEGWRGEVVHCVETDPAGRVAHYKVQDPSLRNWMGLAVAVRDNEISDFPICNKSFDLSYCGNDL